MVALAVIGVLGATVTAPSWGASSKDGLVITVLSNRADLVSGGDALVAISRPARVTVNGADASGRFVERPDGRFVGLLTELQVGDNLVTATDGRRGARLTVTNHPLSGPVFSGPQLRPWVCQSTATTAACDEPPTYSYLYRPVGPEQPELKPYDPANPPPDVSTTTTDEGVTVPFIVRKESGYINRDAYTIMQLFQPERSWTPTEPQEQWNHKAFFGGGAGCGMARTVGAPPLGDEPAGGFTHPKTYQLALSRGFAVFSSALANTGHSCNLAVAAESLMMVKERLVDSYGEVRYTISNGCSGGAIVQQWLANAYPGILDGITLACTYPDLHTALVQFVDGHQLRGYLEDPTKWSPGVAWTERQIAAVEGHAVSTNAMTGSLLLSDRVASPSSPECPGVAAEQRYEPTTNPDGVRCGVMDYNVNTLGPRPETVWTANEAALGRGFAGSTIDDVGVQFGLEALRSGAITPEMFVDLNEKIGGLDIDFQRRSTRSEGDVASIAAAYRSGLVNMANNSDTTPMISGTGPDPTIAHDVVHSFWIRERLDREHGGHPNHVMWQGPMYGPGYPGFFNDAFLAMDRWLTAVEKDTTARPRADKVAANRPLDVRDQCKSLDGAVLNEGHCPEPLQTKFSTPRNVAGMGATSDVLKCQLKPLDRQDYAATPLTDAQWARMQATFPTGVCDYSKPGVGQQPTATWLSYGDSTRHVYGGTPMAPPPESTPFAVRASGSAAGALPVLPATGGGPPAVAAAVLLVALALLRRRRPSTSGGTPTAMSRAHRRARTRTALVAASVILLAGCGSTVQPTGSTLVDQGLGATDGAGLGLPDGAGPVDSSSLGGPLGAPGPDGASTTTDVTGSLGANPAGGPALGVTNEDGRAGTASQPTGAAITRPLKLGVTRVDFSALAATFGVAAPTGDPFAAWKNLIAHLNENGGLAGRQIQPDYYTIDGASSDAAGAVQAACTHFTQDRRADVVFSAGLNNSQGFSQCLLKHGIPQFDSGQYLEDATEIAKTPNQFTPAALAHDRMAATLLKVAVGRGWITTKDKLGVVTQECPVDNRVYDQQIVPAMKAARIPVIRATTDCIRGNADIGRAASQVQSAVLRFRSEGVTSVTLLGAPEGAAVLLFAQTASQQKYFPGYLLTSNSFAWDNSQGNWPADQLPGMKGVGHSPVLDVGLKAATTARQAQAQAVCKSMDPTLADANSSSQPTVSVTFFYGICDTFRLLDAMLTSTRGAVDVRAFATAYREAATSLTSAKLFDGTFAAGEGRRDGARVVVPFSYKTACRCMSFDGSAVPTA